MIRFDGLLNLLGLTRVGLTMMSSNLYCATGIWYRYNGATFIMFEYNVWCNFVHQDTWSFEIFCFHFSGFPFFLILFSKKYIDRRVKNIYFVKYVPPDLCFWACFGWPDWPHKIVQILLFIASKVWNYVEYLGWSQEIGHNKKSWNKFFPRDLFEFSISTLENFIFV